MKIVFTPLALVALAIASQLALGQAGLEGPMPAQHDHATHQQAEAPSPQAKADKPSAGPHGGALQQVGELQLETLVEPGGLRLFAYDRAGEPLELSQARGLATLQIEGNAKRYRYDLFPELGQDKRATSLAVAVDLSQIAGQKVDIAFQLMGLQSGQRKPLQFTAAAAVPMTEAQQVAAAIAEQKVCPVSGQPLGAMGKPIAVEVGEQTVYVCCAACIEKVRANPAKYATAIPTVELATVTEADASLITRQVKCPVMDEPLGSKGELVKLLVDGKPIFLCCKGCVKKVEAEPLKYLKQVYGDAALPSVASGGEEVRPGVFKVTEADQPFIVEQKLCPVMDEPLDGMGGPYRITAEGRAIYICCPDCAKKIAASPQKYLAILQAKGVEPPVVK